MTSQPVTESDLSFFQAEAERRREVFEARRRYGGRRSKYLPGPDMQMKLINGVKLSVWMIIAIVIMSYVIIRNTKGDLEDPGNSFQDHTRQIQFHSNKGLEDLRKQIHGPKIPNSRDEEIVNAVEKAKKNSTKVR